MAKILIIDDDGIVRDALKAILGQKGHTVLTARGGMEGLELLKSASPDLILLNQDLPGMTGSEVLTEIRRVNSGARVIVLTGHPYTQGEAKYRELGISAFLSKGDDSARLLEAVERELPGRCEILVADDERAIRLILQRFLEGKGYRVKTAENGKKALEILEGFSPQLIILDMNMPVLDGMETLRQLRNAGKNTPVMMITGDGDEERARQCMELGAYDFIVKPFDMAYLEMSVWAKIQAVQP